MSQSEAALHFGLGPAPAAEEITVLWPSGLTESYRELAPRSRVLIKEGVGMTTSTFLRGH